jgi:hypothetical protein
MWEARQLVKQVEALLEEEKRREGADPGHIAEMEHHVNAARRNYTIAKRVADARERAASPTTTVRARAAAEEEGFTRWLEETTRYICETHAQ